MKWSVVLLLVLLPMACGATFDQTDWSDLTDQGWNPIIRVLTLRDYNTRVVVAGVTLLGFAAGLVGSFTLLRRRALLGDALSHATLPGVALAFLIAPWFGLDGKSLPVLLTGAAISGITGVLVILFVRNSTRLKEDAALGIVLSVFFGAGIALLTIIQQMPEGHAAGLESFIYGRTALMVADDAQRIAIAAGLVAIALALVFKELRLLCFDEGFAVTQGRPILLLDLILMALVVLITLIGLQAVGLVLVIALLVIPAAAARFWTEDLVRMTLISSAIGAVSGLIGAALSGMLADAPSGAVIVLVCSGLFFVSLVFGSQRGLLVRFWRRWQLNRAVDRQHVLRQMFELLEESSREADISPQQHVTVSELKERGSWDALRLRRQLNRAERAGHLRQHPGDALSLTAAGLAEASRLVHEHRLWELYLITHADVAPARVDRSADAIEHVLEPELIRQLELLLDTRRATQGVASSPHPLAVPTSSPEAAR